MQVLQNKRKRSLTPVTVFAAFADRTSRRIEEKSPVVSLSIVVAGNPKAQESGGREKIATSDDERLLGASKKGKDMVPIRNIFLRRPAESHKFRMRRAEQ